VQHSRGNVRDAVIRDMIKATNITSLYLAMTVIGASKLEQNLILPGMSYTYQELFIFIQM